MQAWPGASQTVRTAMAAQSHRFLNFSLSMVEATGDGLFPQTHYDTSAETAQYFGIGTLELFGFFDAKACFWSKEDPSACLVGRSYKQRRVLYDQMAASAFRKLADNHGEGSDYIGALGKMGIIVPLPMRSDFNGPTNASTPSSPPPPPIGPPLWRPMTAFEIGVAVGVGVTCATIGLIAVLMRSCSRRCKPAKAPGSVQLAR